MKVKDVLPYLQTPARGVERSGKGPRPERVPSGRPENTVTEAGDRVELRSRRMVEEARNRAQEIPEVREEKVEALRRRIESGAYRVAPEKVARAMLADLLRDIY